MVMVFDGKKRQRFILGGKKSPQINYRPISILVRRKNSDHKLLYLSKFMIFIKILKIDVIN